MGIYRNHDMPLAAFFRLSISPHRTPEKEILGGRRGKGDQIGGLAGMSLSAGQQADLLLTSFGGG